MVYVRVKDMHTCTSKVIKPPVLVLLQADSGGVPYPPPGPLLQACQEASP